MKPDDKIENTVLADNLTDVQNTKGNYVFSIDNVGIKNLKRPITVKSKHGSSQSTIATFSVCSNLSANLRGANMSRLVLCVSEYNMIEWDNNSFKKLLDRIRDCMQSTAADISIDFTYFMKREAPISKVSAWLNYECSLNFSLKKVKDKDVYENILTVRVPITSLCPCSKAISDFSAHNQRGMASISINFCDDIFIEDIIEIAEASASCRIHPALKRVDEKYVTEEAYKKPMFVEDIVRTIASELIEDPRVTYIKAESEHMESIHNHNAYAKIEYQR